MIAKKINAEQVFETIVAVYNKDIDQDVEHLVGQVLGEPAYVNVRKKFTQFNIGNDALEITEYFDGGWDEAPIQVEIIFLEGKKIISKETIV